MDLVAAGLHGNGLMAAMAPVVQLLLLLAVWLPRAVDAFGSPSLLGCFNNTAQARVLAYAANAQTCTPASGTNSLESCARLCCAAGFTAPTDLMGVEYGCQCYCGHALANNPAKLPAAECSKMPCPGNASEHCGDGDKLNVFKADCSAMPAVVNPSQSLCGHPDHAGLEALPFCNATNGLDERVRDLVARLTVDEKVALMASGAAVPRLGVPACPFGEALHGSVSHCYGGDPSAGISAPERGVCPTSFPHALLLAASFNRSLWRLVGDAISTEARSFNNLGVNGDLGKTVTGLMVWAPNLNLYRDPRWGRGHETPGEDPFLTSEFGVELISGMQTGVGNRTSTKYLKVASIVKHAFDYDLEGTHGPADRQGFDAVVTSEDEASYYWRPFKAVVTRANASGLMCSYNAVRPRSGGWRHPKASRSVFCACRSSSLTSSHLSCHTS